MKISMKDLEVLIERYLLIENEDTTLLGTVASGPENIRKAKDTLQSDFLGAVDPEVLNAIVKSVSPIVEAKEEADMPDIDAYFHPLGCVQGFVTLADKYDPDVIATNVRQLGQYKEIADYMNPFSATPFSETEFEKDLTNNEIGINVGAQYLRTGNLDLNRIYDELPYSPMDLQLRKVADGKSAMLWNYIFNCRYGWAFKEYPHLYGPNKKFIQPRYNIKLTPEGRGKDWAIWQKENGSLPWWANSIKEDPANLLHFTTTSIPAEYEACSAHAYTIEMYRAGEPFPKEYLDLKLNYVPLPK